MIERHITFDVQPGRESEFEQFFATRYAPAMSASPGFVRVDLLRAADSVGRYVMLMRWQDGAAATGWRTSPVHTALQPALNELVSTGEIQVYAVVG